MKKAQKIVVIGGGTGTYAVLSGLKKYPKDMVDLTAIVTMADSGGSTGRLRDEFGYLPVGDVRQALVALADEESSMILRQLLMHRFKKGEGLAGHNFGNLLLVALTDIFGDEAKAIRAAEKILHVHGRVLPVTTDNTTLVAHFSDGSVVKGESEIDEPPADFDDTTHITKIELEPHAKANPKAVQAIIEADLIVMGPGDLYTSILPNIIVDDIAEALQKTDAYIAYITNLMTRLGQTHGYKASDFIRVMERYINRKIDFILVNNTQLPQDVLELYAQEKEYPVEDDLEKSLRNIVRADLVSAIRTESVTGDTLKRSLMRHDSDKIAKELITLFDRPLLPLESIETN